MSGKYRNILKELHEREKKIVGENGCLSINSKGRKRKEEPSGVRTCFQRDRDRIIHSSSFRNLKRKTQVFISPNYDYYRTRLTHTITVSQIARTIGRGLMLNEDLVEAIALGHDLGHTPFGHTGEDELDRLSSRGFKHYVHSLRVVDVLEKNGKGLNLTHEVRDGIVKHSKGSVDLIGDIGSVNPPMTLEGTVVRISDSIAYLNHDLDDALKAGIIKNKDIPEKALNILGISYSRSIDTMVAGIVSKSIGTGKVLIPKEVLKGMNILKDFLYTKVYPHPGISDFSKRSRKMVSTIFSYFKNYPDKFKNYHKSYLDVYDLEQNLIDYIASLSDDRAIALYEKIV